MNLLMLIFIDTEFTDFDHMELISVGLVTEDGENEFYAEVPVKLAKCNDFVIDTVLPQLGQVPGAQCTKKELKQRLLQWLQPFANHSPTICFDYSGDWQLLCSALDDEIPSWLGNQNIYANLDQEKLEMFFIQHGLLDHHALNDAKANRYAYDPAKIRADLNTFKKSR